MFRHLWSILNCTKLFMYTVSGILCCFPMEVFLSFRTEVIFLKLPSEARHHEPLAAATSQVFSFSYCTTRGLFEGFLYISNSCNKLAIYLFLI